MLRSLSPLSATSIAISLAACAPADPVAPVSLRPAVHGEGSLVVAITRRGGHPSETKSVTVTPDRFPIEAHVPEDVDTIKASLWRGAQMVAYGEGDLEGVVLEPTPMKVNLTDGQAWLAVDVVGGQQMARTADGGFTIVWQQDPNVRARSFDRLGRPREVAGGDRGEVRLAPRTSEDVAWRRGLPRLFSSGTGVLAVHEAVNYNDYVSAFEMSVLDDQLAVGPPIGTAAFHTREGHRSPSVTTRPGGDTLVAWIDTDDLNAEASPDPFGSLAHARLAPNGEVLETTSIVSKARRALPQVAPCGGGYVLIWLEETNAALRLMAQVVDARAGWLQPDVEIATDLSPFRTVARVVPSDGAAIIVWNQPADGRELVRAVRIDGAAALSPYAEIARATSIDSLSVSVADGETAMVAWSAGGFAGTPSRVSWTRIERDLSLRYPARTVDPLALAPQYAPSIAYLGDGVAAIAWTESVTVSSESQIRARLVYEPALTGSDGAR